MVPRTLLVLAFVCAACAAPKTETSGAKAAPPGSASKMLFAADRMVRSLARGADTASAASGAFADTIGGGLQGWLTPLGSRSPDGKQVGYASWRDAGGDPKAAPSQLGMQPGDASGQPSLRIWDAATGSDSVLAEGADGLAWAGDGRVAYFKGDEPFYRQDQTYAGQVVVGDLDGPKVRWTTQSARYVPVGWAGEHLVLYRESEGEHLDVLIADGPGEVRDVAPGASVVAISPDGSSVFVERTTDSPIVSVLRVSDGTQIASLDLSKQRTKIEWLSYAGDWSGSRIVARGKPGLVVFKLDGARLTLEKVLALAPPAYPDAAREPVFEAGSDNRLVAYSDVPGGTAVLRCVVTAGACKRVETRSERGVHPIRDAKAGAR